MLIDRFSKALSASEAAELLSSSYIKFNDDGLPKSKIDRNLLNQEGMFIRLLVDFFHGENMVVKLPKPLSEHIKIDSWIVEHLTQEEYVVYHEMQNKYLDSILSNPSKNELILLIKLSCRDLFFPIFETESVRIEGSHEMVFVVETIEEQEEQKLNALVMQNELFLR